jgi:hypothetical protein
LTPILQEKKCETNILSQGGPFRPKNSKMPLWWAKNAFLGPKKITTAFLTSQRIAISGTEVLNQNFGNFETP